MCHVFVHARLVVQACLPSHVLRAALLTASPHSKHRNGLLIASPLSFVIARTCSFYRLCLSAPFWSLALPTPGCCWSCTPPSRGDATTQRAEVQPNYRNPWFAFRHSNVRNAALNLCVVRVLVIGEGGGGVPPARGGVGWGCPRRQARPRRGEPAARVPSPVVGVRGGRRGEPGFGTGSAAAHDVAGVRDGRHDDDHHGHSDGPDAVGDHRQ
jgi:hypothetical protein